MVSPFAAAVAFSYFIRRNALFAWVYLTADGDERSMTTMISNPSASGGLALYRPSSRSCSGFSAPRSPATLYLRGHLGEHPSSMCTHIYAHTRGWTGARARIAL
jgi:hypothetical protein